MEKENLNNELYFIMTRLPSIGVIKSQERTTFHNEKATIHLSNKNLNNRLPCIMTRLPTIDVTKSQQQNTFQMTRLLSIGVLKSQQQTTFHNDKATIHWSNKNMNRLPSIITRLLSIGVTKMLTTDYLP